MTSRGFWIAAAFATGFALWTLIFLTGCFALMVAGRFVVGLF